MRKVLALLATLVVSSCAMLEMNGAASPQQAAQIERGRALAEEHCAVCHAIGATGESPAQAAPPFREIGDRLDASTLNGFITQGVSFTHPRMPSFELGTGETRALAAYLRSVQDAEQNRHRAP